MRLKVVLWLLLGAALTASAWVAVARGLAISAGREVELALSLRGARASAVTRAYRLDQILERYRDAGITTLMVNGTTLQALLDTGATGYPASYPVLISVDAGTAPDAQAITVRENPALAAWLAERLRARLPGDGAVGAVSAGGAHTITVRGLSRESLLALDLGVHPADLDLARKMGWRVAAEFEEGEGSPATPATPAALLAGLPAGTPILFMGEGGVPQPDTLLPLVQSNRNLVLVDHSKPPFSPGLAGGVAELAAGTGFRAAKLFRVTFSHSVDDILTAVKERRMRFVLVQPYHISSDLEADLVEQAGRWAQLRARLLSAGFLMGWAELIGPFTPPLWALLLAGMAVGAAGCLLLDLRCWTGLACVLGGGAVALVGHLDGAIGRYGLQSLALAAAILLPALGGALVLEAHTRAGAHESGAGGRTIVRDLLWLAGSGLAAGLLVTTLLGDVRFALEFELFRGIKLALVGPSVLLLGLGVWRMRGRLQGVLSSGLRLWQAGIAAAAAVAIIFMLIRSGQDSDLLLVTGLELKLRMLLEHVFVARPRFKEFLVGWPFAVLAVASLRRRTPPGIPLLLPLALMAPASLANSFEHLHTPVWISALRSVHGLWIGSLLGLLLLGLWRRRGGADHV